MKRIIFLSIVAFIRFQFSFAQERADLLTSVTIQSDTATLAPTYNNSFSGSVYYDGVAGFQFTVTNTVDTLDVIYFEGSYNDLNYVVISSLDTVLNGNYSLYDAPPVYLNYRLRIPGVSGDTATITNPIYFQKKTKK